MKANTVEVEKPASSEDHSGDKIADVPVAMQRQEPLDADLLKDLRFDGNDSEYSGPQYSCLILEIHMSLVSTVEKVNRMYTTQTMTGCKPTLSLHSRWTCPM